MPHALVYVTLLRAPTRGFEIHAPVFFFSPLFSWFLLPLRRRIRLSLPPLILPVLLYGNRASNIEDTEAGDLENQRLKLRKRTMKRLSKSESCSGEANLIAAAVKAAAVRDLEWRNRKLWFD
ncbi:hypothetical protein LINPERPRIM_LOCUS10315 [Linum perenne]